MELEGKIILDLGEQSGTSKAGNLWKKHEWVLETFGQFPRKVKFTVFGSKLDNIHIEAGKSYKISVDAESREFNGRWYTDINAYAATEIGAPQPNFGSAPTAAPAAPADPFAGAPSGFAAPADPFASNNETDDLPF